MMPTEHIFKKLIEIIQNNAIKFNKNNTKILQKMIAFLSIKPGDVKVLMLKNHP